MHGVLCVWSCVKSTLHSFTDFVISSASTRFLLVSICIIYSYVSNITQSLLHFAPFRQNPVDGEADWFYGDSWAQMYQVDPEPFPMPASNIVKTEGGEREVMVGRALGGEASMWTEQVDDWNIESQVGTIRNGYMR